GLSDVSITVNGLNFSTSASEIFGGQRLQPRSVSATQVAVTLPIALLSSIGTKTLEIVNSAAARISTPFRIVPIPENFPRVSVTGNLEPFSTLVTAISTVQRYTVSGTNLRDSLIVQAPQGFELSSDGAVWLPGRIAFAPQNSTLTQAISVRFRPLLSQNVSGFITHSSGGIVLQSLAVQGNPRSLALNIEPNGVIDLGSTRVGRNLRISLSLTNPHTVGITLATIITGANPADFSVSGQQIVIPPSSSGSGGRATLEVVFSPRARGEREAIINLSGIASGQVTVRGRGVQAIFTLSPQDIIFATSAFVGQTARLPAETVRITNTGDVDDELSGLTLQGASGAFRLQGLFMPTRLQAGEVTSITLDF
ncbi:MAG: choice-of-anchor D domain-containing protein, partial [Candidatus Kapaibacteriota bacterium]